MTLGDADPPSTVGDTLTMDKYLTHPHFKILNHPSNKVSVKSHCHIRRLKYFMKPRLVCTAPLSVWKHSIDPAAVWRLQLVNKING